MTEEQRRSLLDDLPMSFRPPLPEPTGGTKRAAAKSRSPPPPGSPSKKQALEDFDLYATVDPDDEDDRDDRLAAMVASTTDPAERQGLWDGSWSRAQNSMCTPSCTRIS